jgi:gluconate 2-dehydrogenase gamma chain
MTNDLNRRAFLFRAGTGLSAAWVSVNWPALLSAAMHARYAAQAATPPGFEFFTPDEAAEIDAIAGRIIPTDDTSGAREAGVVYFVDHSLATFALDSQKTFREGLSELQASVSEMFPTVQKFSAATPERQDEILHLLSENAQPSNRQSRPRPGAQNFFQTLRQFTIAGFLIDPDSGGNRDGAGWKVIGREHEHMFTPPFGYYDKDYPGWHPAAPEADKK